MLKWGILFAVALLSGMGVGGGGLLILYLIWMENRDQLGAQGMNLLFFLLCCAGALPMHAGKGNLPLPAAGVLGIGTAAGALLGCSLTRIVPVFWLRKLFGGLLLLSGGWILFSSFRRRNG